MIIFRENQNKIFVGKNKIQQSSYPGYLDYHIVCEPNVESGYGNNKYVKVVSFENIYSLEDIKSFETNIMYFENGGYIYDKKAFQI